MNTDEIILFALRFDMNNPSMIERVECKQQGRNDAYSVTIHLRDGQQTAIKMSRADMKRARQLYENFGG